MMSSKRTLLLRLRFAISSRRIAAARASPEYDFGVDTKCVAPPLFIYLCAAHGVRRVGTNINPMVALK